MNIKKSAVLFSALFFFAWGLRAADAPAAPKRTFLRTWFEHLKEGLSESAVQSHYQKNRVTAVAAVRGAQQDVVNPDKPAWKGGQKAKKSAQAKKERAQFGKAVDFILEGKTKEGLEALDAFEKAHPKSALLPDVEQARAKALELQAAEAESPVPAQ